MAVDVKPVLIIAGEVISVAENSYTNRETGEVVDKGRVAVVKTARGFVELKFPLRSKEVAVSAGDVGAWYVTPFEWGNVVPNTMPPRARYGVAYLYEEALPQKIADDILGFVGA